MDMNRRRFVSLLGLAGAGAALAGCVPGATQSAPSAASIQAASPADAKGEVTYWNHFTGEDERRGFGAVTSGYAKNYPQVTLKSESIPNSDFMTKFTTAVQSRSVPNSVMVHANRVQDMVAMQGLVDLTDPLSAWSGKSDIADKILAPFKRQDRVYAVPSAMFVDWYYYRADWLQEAGLSAPPATWAEFRQLAKTMTDPARGRHGFALRGGAGGGEHIIKMIRAFNGPLVDADGKPALKKEAVATALEEYSAPYLVDKSAALSAPSDGYTQVFQSFLNGNTGMLMHHTGSLKSVTAALKSGVQVMTAPMPKAEFETGWIQPLGNGLMTLDGAATSLSWLEYWGSAAPQLDMFNATGYFPASTSGQSSPTITSDPLFAAALKQIERGTTPEYFTGMQAWQDNSVLVQFQALLVGKASVSQAADSIVADFNTNF
ncbi:extracellular solute-binding protein [Pseudarthrobacter sp. R1]|uniref:ABC transporter substrate-binding protein n=1 Tax=Pseudarthrobacter sp. R1 TaxID=2944934 RepID=UPI00210AA6BA|nr:extracellular solute-binding protein [Pseudarthrobacter sp. R1]MCQ6273352.1 extracellular solute-binding protein [Pseudarthrobacter sp. R1]